MSKQQPSNVSTGRGGSGNIGKDDGTVYTDGGSVREGPVGSGSGGDFSTGRGGRGNIVEDETVAIKRGRSDGEYVPEVNVRTASQDDFHTGRGGAGNEHREKYGGHSTKHEQEHEGVSIMDKVKNALGMGGK